MAELRLLPMLCTHLTVPEIAAETFLLPHTITSRRWSRSTASWTPPTATRPSPGPANWTSWRG